MASNIEKLAQELAEKYPEMATLLRADAQVARKLGVPESLSSSEANESAPAVEQVKIYPEISLSEEHQRQSLILAGRFAARLHMSEEAYRATLPEFPESPADYPALGLTVPMIFAEGSIFFSSSITATAGVKCAPVINIFIELL